MSHCKSALVVFNIKLHSLEKIHMIKKVKYRNLEKYD